MQPPIRFSVVRSVRYYTTLSYECHLRKTLRSGFLCIHARGPHLSYSAAAKVLKKSKHFVQMWVAQKMLQIYEPGLLRSAEKMFGANIKDWILQEDNAPKHRSHLCTSWKAENGIATLDWPSQSSDANTIENVWSVVKRKLAGRDTFTLKQLSQRIKEV